RAAWPASGGENAPETEPEGQSALKDDRSDVLLGDRVLLIIEDDPTLAQALLQAARAKGFKRVVASQGDQALDLARQFDLTAISLEIHLRHADGWALLDQVKHDPKTRHIHVQILTAEEDRERGLKMGAFAVLSRPADDAALHRSFDHLVSFIERREKR